MYKADACKMQAPALYVVEKLQMQMLNGFFKRLGLP